MKLPVNWHINSLSYYRNNHSLTGNGNSSQLFEVYLFRSSGFYYNVHHLILKCHFKFYCKSIKYNFNKQGFPLFFKHFFEFFLSLKLYEMSGEIDYFQTLIPCPGGLGRVDSCMAGDDVVAGRILVHPFISNYPNLRKACGKILFF